MGSELMRNNKDEDLWVCEHDTPKYRLWTLYQASMCITSPLPAICYVPPFESPPRACEVCDARLTCSEPIGEDLNPAVNYCVCATCDRFSRDAALCWTQAREFLALARRCDLGE